MAMYPSSNVRDLESYRPGYSMARVRAALMGRFDAAELSDDEERIFDDLLGEAMGTVGTPAARAFWVSFEGQRNTDVE